MTQEQVRALLHARGVLEQIPENPMALRLALRDILAAFEGGTAVTGPEHYEHAEKCLGWAESEHDRDKRTSLQLRAQVHATLALAAATALDPAKTCTGGDWIAVAGVQS